MAYKEIKPHILVVGDIMLDEYLWCDVERISPEAPIPIAKLNKTSLVPGGAANVANNLVHLESEVHLVGFCGLDHSAQLLKKALKTHSISDDCLVANNHFQTIRKSRILAQNQQILRLDQEDSKQKIAPQMFNQATQHIEQFIPISKAIILSDYGKNMCSESFCLWLSRKAREYDIPLLIDPKGNHYEKYKGAYIIKPNFKEFEEAINQKINSEIQLEEEGFKLIEKLNIEYLIITRSKKGMTILSANQERFDLDTEAKEVTDISGAGDTVIASLAWCLAHNVTIKEATKLSNYAAGIVVGKVGTASIKLSDINTHPIFELLSVKK